jgi:hypothetical protein
MTKRGKRFSLGIIARKKVRVLWFYLNDHNKSQTECFKKSARQSNRTAGLRGNFDTQGTQLTCLSVIVPYWEELAKQQQDI